MSMISAFFSEFEFRSGEMYSIQYYVIKFLSGLRLAGGLFLGTPVSSTNKTGRHDISVILLKVALNTINHQPHVETLVWQLNFTNREGPV